jgi:hypothetical protein
VELDLQGFTLRGNIQVSNVNNVTLTNGTVITRTAMGYLSPVIEFQNVTGCRIEGITLNGASFADGLVVTGNRNMIKRNSLSSGFTPLSVSGSGNSVVHNSMGNHNSRPAVSVSGNDTVISGNDIRAGFTSPAGIALDGTGIVLEDSFIDNDSGWGIAVVVSGHHNTVHDVTAVGGISVSGDRHLIEENTVVHHYVSDGIYVSGVGNVIRRNTVSEPFLAFVDLSGTPTTCTDNKWQNNTFTTANPPCIR